MNDNNRLTFVNNIIKFLNDEGIDGVDIDWKYPGVCVPCLRSPEPLSGCPISQSVSHHLRFFRQLTNLYFLLKYAQLVDLNYTTYKSLISWDILCNIINLIQI
jgi:hypothetical protein